jgi:hypothetical protein
LRKGFAGIVDAAKINIEQLTDFYDQRELAPDEIKNLKSDLGYYEMYDIYEKQTQEFKEKQIKDHNGPIYFEIDLDAIAHRATFNQIRKQHVDQILPVINAYVW